MGKEGIKSLDSRKSAGVKMRQAEKVDFQRLFICVVVLVYLSKNNISIS